MKNKIKIKLTYFLGEYSTEQISEIIGMDTDKSEISSLAWVKSWEFTPREKYVEDELSDIVNLLSSNKPEILSITNNSELSISGSFYSHGSLGIHISSSTIKKIGEFNIPLDIDVYDLSNLK